MVLLSSIEDKQLEELLKRGAVGVLPTDTVYGLVTLASNVNSVRRLYEIKGRVGEKRGTLIAHDIDQLAQLGIKKRYLKAVEQFWPNPLSIILPISESLYYLSQGNPTLAQRVVADKKLSRLLEEVGPLLTTSANTPGDPPAVDVSEAQKYFGDRVDFYVDGGNLAGNKSSTIIQIVDDAIEIIRPGALNIDEKGKILG